MAQPAKRPAPKAPELGAFPLDHFRECKTEVEQYYTCLERNNRVTPLCRDETKAYLQCRMDKGLMNPMDMNKFGIPNSNFVPSRMHKEDTIRDSGRGTGAARHVPSSWEAKFKNPELDREDGFEVDRVTGQPVELQRSVQPYAPSRFKGDTI